MSEQPPLIPPQPPQDYGPYYRGTGPTNLDPEKLRLLKDGYFGLNMVFLLNVAFAIGSNVIFRGLAVEPAVGLGFLAVFLITIGALTYPSNKKIGTALGWEPSGAILASILMGLFAWICCGAFGYMIMQNKALRGMKDYGISAGAFGLKKKVVEQRIAELEMGQQYQNMPPMS